MIVNTKYNTYSEQLRAERRVLLMKRSYYNIKRVVKKLPFYIACLFAFAFFYFLLVGGMVALEVITQ